MKIAIAYILAILTGLFAMGMMVLNSESPEVQIQGTWNEVAWEYEMIEKNYRDSIQLKKVADYVKNVTGQNLVIHEAETWSFRPDGTLTLCGDNYRKEVTWRIKGRGNLLLLKYDNGLEEHYNITHIDEDSMVINFDADAQARGIARLTFEKVN